MKDALIEYETLDSEQVDDLMARKSVRPPKDWHKVDDDLKPGSGSIVAEDKGASNRPDSPIGGAANEH